MRDARLSRDPRLWIAVLASGVVVGAMAVAFHAGLEWALARREGFEAFVRPYGAAGALCLAGACATAVGAAVWLTSRFAPQAAGSGIQHVEGVLRGLLPPWSFAVVWVKFVGGIVGIGGGLLLGREGPTVQMGASLAERLGRRMRIGEAGERVLLVVGAGAGLAGAFGAPLGGAFFAVEELGVPWRSAAALGALVASLLTDAVCRFWLGGAELSLSGVEAPGLSMLPSLLVVAVLAGALGVLVNALLLRALAAGDRLKRRVPAWVLGAALGAVLGAVAWRAPGLPGGGVTFAASLLHGGVASADAAWLLPASLVLTAASYAVGAPGGLFAPLLVIGALLGLVFHAGVVAAAPALAAPMPVLAAAGMAGAFTGSVRAPFTGAVLLVEMTGTAHLALPLLLSSLAAQGVAKVLGGRPIYASLLERARSASGA